MMGAMGSMQGGPHVFLIMQVGGRPDFEKFLTIIQKIMAFERWICTDRYLESNVLSFFHIH